VDSIVTLPILIVDDDAGVVLLLSKLLTRAGYEGVVARNGHEAIARLKEGHFGAVVLDLLMPEVNGFEVLQHLKATDRDMLKRVIVLTAAGEQTLQYFDPSMVHAVLHKPADSAALLEHIRQCAGAPPARKLTPNELRQRRLDMGWSVDELASKIGVSGSLIAEWERGGSPITTPAAIEQVFRQAEQPKPGNRARKLKGPSGL
jgi:CheY-like chemotaxis protein/DNA-binding XRE family transcriptional regulator